MAVAWWSGGEVECGGGGVVRGTGVVVGRGGAGRAGHYHNLWTACSRMVTFFSFLRVEVLGGGGGSGTSPTKAAHPFGLPSPPPPCPPPHPLSTAHTSPGGRSLTTVHARCASSCVDWSVEESVRVKQSYVPRGAALRPCLAACSPRSSHIRREIQDCPLNYLESYARVVLPRAHTVLGFIGV